MRRCGKVDFSSSIHDGKRLQNCQPGVIPGAGLLDDRRIGAARGFTGEEANISKTGL